MSELDENNEEANQLSDLVFEGTSDNDVMKIDCAYQIQVKEFICNFNLNNDLHSNHVLKSGAILLIDAGKGNDTIYMPEIKERVMLVIIDAGEGDDKIFMCGKNTLARVYGNLGNNSFIINDKCTSNYILDFDLSAHNQIINQDHNPQNNYILSRMSNNSNIYELNKGEEDLLFISTNRELVQIGEITQVI